MTNKRLQFTVGILALVGVAAAVQLGWAHRAQAVKEARAIKAWQQIPPASAYPNAVAYQGTQSGFHSVTIASIVRGQNSATAGVAGSWVLTYTGNNPPLVQQISLTGIVRHTPFNIMVRGFQPSLTAIRIGAHQYLYYETQWNNPTWAFSVTQSRLEFQTSVALIQLASGQVITVPQQSPKI